MIKRKYEAVVFSLLMAFLMSGIISLVIQVSSIGLAVVQLGEVPGDLLSAVLTGLPGGLLKSWVSAWSVAFVTAFPVALLVTPLVKNLVKWLIMIESDGPSTQPGSQADGR